MLACFLSATSVFVQKQIILKRRNAFLNDKKLSKQELAEILMSDLESSVDYLKAKSNGIIGAVPILTCTTLCILGSFKLLMSSLEDAKTTSSGSLETTYPAKGIIPILAGVGLVLVGLPFAISLKQTYEKINQPL